MVVDAEFLVVGWLMTSSLAQSLEQFAQQLHALQQQSSQAHPDGRRLQALFLTTQQQFQVFLSLVEQTELTTAVEVPLRSQQTEVNRQLRLLGMDVAFLQTARQPQTVQQRQAQMGDRIRTLEQFCQGLRQTLAQEKL